MLTARLDSLHDLVRRFISFYPPSEILKCVQSFRERIKHKWNCGIDSMSKLGKFCKRCKIGVGLNPCSKIRYQIDPF